MIEVLGSKMRKRNVYHRSGIGCCSVNRTYRAASNEHLGSGDVNGSVPASDTARLSDYRFQRDRGGEKALLRGRERREALSCPSASSLLRAVRCTSGECAKAPRTVVPSD